MSWRSVQQPHIRQVHGLCADERGRQRSVLRVAGVVVRKEGRPLTLSAPCWGIPIESDTTGPTGAPPLTAAGAGFLHQGQTCWERRRRGELTGGIVRSVLGTSALAYRRGHSSMFPTVYSCRRGDKPCDAPGSIASHAGRSTTSTDCSTASRSHSSHKGREKGHTHTGTARTSSPDWESPPRDRALEPARPRPAMQSPSDTADNCSRLEASPQDPLRR